MTVPDHELIALVRSAAMQPSGSRVMVDRETLIESLEELIQTRHMLARLGTDLKTIARRGQP